MNSSLNPKEPPAPYVMYRRAGKLTQAVTVDPTGKSKVMFEGKRNPAKAAAKSLAAFEGWPLYEGAGKWILIESAKCL